MEEDKKELATEGLIQKQVRNFNPQTGEKLNEVCQCWVKHKPYNCGFNKCPGYKLHSIELTNQK